MAEFDEKYNSRVIRRGVNPSFEITYIVVNEPNEYDATELVVNGIDPTATIDGADYPITDVQGEALADEIWEVTVTYGMKQGNVLNPEEHTVSFDTSGARAKVTHSLGTTAYVASGTAPDFDGAVGVTKSSVEGAEVTVPGLTFSIKKRMPASIVTQSYINTLADLTGKYNNATFAGRAAGEVRFDGATGDQQAPGADVDITYKFTVSPNASGLAVGGITGISKLGWQYLWVLFAESDDSTANFLVQTPLAVYVEDLPNLEPANFAALQIGT